MAALPDCRNLKLDQEAGWLTICLDRPETRNALTDEMIAELASVLAVVRGDRTVRGITLRGNGGVFCAGGDLKSFRGLLDDKTTTHDAVAAISRRAGQLFHTLNEQPRIVIMLVEGAAMAGGLGLACAGDIVAVTADAKFALTEATIGIPPAQIAPLVVQRAGLANARRLMLTAARFDGREAKALGIADFVAEDVAGLDAVEVEIRAAVRRCAPQAIATTKEILHACAHLNRDAIIDAAAGGFAQCLLSEEGREGIAAVLEKRKPSWAE